MPTIRRRTLLAAPLAIPLALPFLRNAAAAEPVRLRVSIESLPTHTRTISAADFCKRVEEASGGEIQTQLFHSGQLFTDQTIVTALLQNQVEMSMPGTWGLAGFVPSVDAMQLPVMRSDSPSL